MTFRHILSSTEEVRSILDGDLKQIKRPVNFTKQVRYPELSDLPFEERKKLVFNESVYKKPMNVGDIIWVKEPWAKTDEGFVYKADCESNSNVNWKTQMFMPMVACRLFLKVIKVDTEVARRKN